MLTFKGKYLRVTTPKTKDGNVPLIIDNVPQTKENYLPISAKSYLERENLKRPEHLRHIIEVIDDSIPADTSKGKKK